MLPQDVHGGGEALVAAVSHDDIADRTTVSVPWLIRLRWGAALGQLAAIAVVHAALATPLPLGRLLPFVGVTIITNGALAWRSRSCGPVSRATCGIALSLDTLTLTALLGASGGPLNPFSILYLVHITLAAVVLGAAWTWALAGLSVACYGALFALQPPLSGHGGLDALHGGAFSMHLEGMWIAFIVAAILTAYFVVQLSAAIERRDAEIAVIRERSARYERLAALTTLAAGAAHELGTPLATIAVSATEIERRLDGWAEPTASVVCDDVRLIRAEVARCRAILDAMMSDAGGSVGEAPASVTVGDILSETLRALPPGEARRVSLSRAGDMRTLVVPRRAVVQAVANLVRNALDATAPAGIVWLSVDVDPRGLTVEVRDTGPGMTAEVLARSREPFFTTKPPGRGLGLGLFLVKTLADQLGGGLELTSAPGVGVTARLVLPRVGSASCLP